jgi:hypothetical protein
MMLASDAVFPLESTRGMRVAPGEEDSAPDPPERSGLGKGAPRAPADSWGLADARAAIAAQIEADADERMQTVSGELMGRLAGAADELREELEGELEDSCGGVPLAFAFSALGALAGIVGGGMRPQDPASRSNRRLLEHLKYKDDNELLLSHCSGWGPPPEPVCPAEKWKIRPDSFSSAIS